MNVTQLIPNYLGGVSRKPDFDKQPGEVRDAVNAFPDDTYGLLKRQGSEFKGTLSSGQEWSDWAFFPLIREGRPIYLIGLTDRNIKIWNLSEGGTECTISIPQNSSGIDGLDYLDWTDIGPAISDSYRVASDDQRSFIVNKTHVVQNDTTLWNSVNAGTATGSQFRWATDNDPGYVIPSPAFTEYGEKFRVANSIGQLPDSSAKEVYITEDGDEPNRETGLLRDGWHVLSTTAKKDNNPDASGLTIKCFIQNGLIQEGGPSEAYKATIVTGGFGYRDKQRLWVDGVPLGQCVINTGLQVGKVYLVRQTEASNDDYYMMPFSNKQFTTNDDALSGPFYWQEVPSPDSRIGLNPATMPYELVENSTNNFTFKQADYSQRWAGDDTANPDPSFVGHTIENAFFSNNRLGFLSQDNVILSRPINYGPEGTGSNVTQPDGNPYVRRNYREIDFFHQSAIQQVADDPIDLNAASNNVSVYQNAIAVPQGVVLFADGNQSLMYADDGVLTPAQATIRSISNYSKDPTIDAVIMGSKYYFINKSSRYCRLYSMINQGQENPPIVEDLGKSVSDWLPNDLTDLTYNEIDSIIITYRRGSTYAYVLKLMDEESSSWVKWEMPAPIEYIVTDEDKILFVLNHNNTLCATVINLFTYPDDNLSTLPSVLEKDVIPYLDFVSDATYDRRFITPPSGFPEISGATPVVEIVDRNGTSALDGNASIYDCLWEDGQLVAPRDLNGSIIIGYRFNFEVTFPTFYLQQDPSGNAPDYTAYMTISRIKFALGLSGDAEFLTKTASGIRLPGVTSEWSTTYSARLAGDYYADRNPFVYEQRVVEVPIHQRNNNFELKVTSNTHLPLSIDSCMWEGIYSPRYYRRS